MLVMQALLCEQADGTCLQAGAILPCHLPLLCWSLHRITLICIVLDCSQTVLHIVSRTTLPCSFAGDTDFQASGLGSDKAAAGPRH